MMSFLFSVCPSGKDRVKISLYGGLKLEGEILVCKKDEGFDSLSLSLSLGQMFS